MKKAAIVLCIVLIAVLLFVVYHKNRSVTSFLESNGVSIYGEYANIDLQRKCYILSSAASQSPEISSETTFTISGIVAPLKETGALSDFSGHMNVAAYPISFETSYLTVVGGITEQYIEIRNSQAVSDLDRWYAVFILKSNPDVIVITIFQEDADTLIAVCGDTEEEALANYALYCEAMEALQSS